MALAPEMRLVDLRAEVMDRCVLNRSGNQGARAQRVIDSQLRSAQRILYNQYDHTKRQIRAEIPLVSGVSQYDVPDTVNFGSIIAPLYVKRLDDGRVFPIFPGINFAQRNAAIGLSGVSSIPFAYSFENQVINLYPTPDVTIYSAIVYDAFMALSPLTAEDDEASVDSEALLQLTEILARPRLGLPEIPNAMATHLEYLDGLLIKSGDDSRCIAGGETSMRVTPEGPYRYDRRDTEWRTDWNPPGNWGL